MRCLDRRPLVRLLCECCEQRQATLDHLADGVHFLVCAECYVPNGVLPRPFAPRCLP